ncbi:Ger(x)C family spore germination C-terminal domain-containing protein [Paenibacillus sp. OV219]|uniref:Ger(x)C family spore germination C-terminal domain-containing protein n=1 Tax=Paenibacillus sp. OV219 TaxID=1884377 RepID=UPI000B87F113|nr:Ger(x)C family spore germination C-terminal domain-containing protein [Paenibacillus sp. OV219]
MRPAQCQHTQVSRDRSALAIDVHLRGRIEEYRGNRDLYERSDLAALKKEVEALLEKQTLSMLKMMQEQGIDPLQIGDLTLRPASKPID